MEDVVLETVTKCLDAKDDEIERLRGIIYRQRRELKRLNKYLGPYWAGFKRGLAMEEACRLRGLMNKAFGHERVHAIEMADAKRRASQTEHD